MEIENSRYLALEMSYTLEATSVALEFFLYPVVIT